MLAHLFAGEILTAVLFGVALANANWSDHAFTMAVVFTLMAIFFEECVAHAARLEMRLTHNLRRDMTSVWTVASAVVLPPAYAALVVTGVSLHIWFRQHRPIGRPLYRTVYNISNYVLATMCADVVVHYFASAWAALPLAVGGAISVLVAIGVYTLVNRLLISTALMLVGVSVKDLRGTRDENLIELATLCLGGLVAVVALHQPWLCLVVLAPMVTL